MSKDDLIKKLGKFMPDQIETLRLMERNDIVNLLKEMITENQSQEQANDTPKNNSNSNKNSKPSNQGQSRNESVQPKDTIKKLRKPKHKDMIEKVL